MMSQARRGKDKPTATPYLILTAAALIIAASPLVAQQYGTVRGTVSDSVTGAPTVAARVAINCQGCYGRQPTDSLGRYVIERVPIGRHRMEFNCPSRTMLGRELAQPTVDVRKGDTSLVDVRVPPGGCFEPAYSERTGIFRGDWTPGFESSAFIPCADSALGLTGDLMGKRPFKGEADAWATLDTAAQKELHPLPKHAPRDAYGSSRYFVVWHGTLKGPGMYGHMGVSEYSMIVDSVLSIRAARPNDCARS